MALCRAVNNDVVVIYVVIYGQISPRYHVTCDFNQSEGSILPNLSDLARYCEISSKNISHLKSKAVEQLC